MKIVRWFKGMGACDGLTQELWQEDGPVGTTSHCLMTQAIFEDQVGIDAVKKMAEIIARHFSARCLCASEEATTRVIHFNNHPETTREDVDKVLRAYTEETEARDRYEWLLP